MWQGRLKGKDLVHKILVWRVLGNWRFVDVHSENKVSNMACRARVEEGESLAFQFNGLTTQHAHKAIQ